MKTTILNLWYKFFPKKPRTFALKVPAQTKAILTILAKAEGISLEEYVEKTLREFIRDKNQI